MLWNRARGAAMTKRNSLGGISRAWSILWISKMLSGLVVILSLFLR